MAGTGRGLHGQRLQQRIKRRSGDAPGTEYTFHYNPATIQGTLTQNLLPTDTNAQVNVKLSDGTQAGAGPYNALNLYCESGNGGTGLGGDICLLLPNDQIATNLQSPTPNYPYILLRVIPKSQTSYQPGYDGSGNWTAIPQGFYAAGQTPAGPATPYATGAQAGSDLQRDGTTTTLSISSSTSPTARPSRSRPRFRIPAARAILRATSGALCFPTA